MSAEDLDDDDDVWDADLFDVENVEWDLPRPKKRSECLIRFYDKDGTSFNMLKIRGALLKLLYHIDQEIGAMGEHPERH